MKFLRTRDCVEGRGLSLSEELLVLNVGLLTSLGGGELKRKGEIS